MITIKVDISSALASLRQQHKQVRFAAAVALTRVAKQAESEVRSEMAQVFDRPTPWALGATRVIPATPQRLLSQVWLKDRRGQPQRKDSNFLFPEVFGGTRGRKAFETRLLQVGWLRSNEFVVPAKGLPLDAHGNVPVGLIRSILSQAGAAGGEGQGYTSNKTQSARSRRTVARRGTFFVSRGQSTGNPLPRGIYQRLRMGSGWATRMIFAIVVGRPRYRPRLRLGQIGDRVVRRDFQREFDRALAQTLATAR